MHIRDSVGTTSNSLLAGLAVPDTDGVTLDGDLSAECAGVLGVLCDFHLLHLLTERSTVSVVGDPSASIGPVIACAPSTNVQQSCRASSFFVVVVRRVYCIPGTIFTCAQMGQPFVQHRSWGSSQHTGDADLLGSLRHLGGWCWDERCWLVVVEEFKAIFWMFLLA